jgi:peptidoglycan/LPS O-acetylase OafA/YrhL
MAFLAFIPRTLQNGAEWPQIVHSLYLCFSRVLFNIGIILTLGPSLLGLKCSFFRTILDTSLFNYIAKISFCGYLVHYIILSQVLGVVTIDTYYSISDRFIINMGILILTFAFATIMVFVIEVPFATLQKELMKKIKHRQP